MKQSYWFFKNIVAVAIFLFYYCISHSGADLVIFSFDRPLQLYALLESIDTYITGLDETHIVYRASNEDFQNAYNKVHDHFNHAIFTRQGNNPSADFKPLTLRATFASPADYIIFAVDDIIIKDFFSVNDAINTLEATESYGVYLRLGLHLTECYPNKCLQPVPRAEHVIDDVYRWTFSHGNNDWRYPFTLDMTLYRKKDIKPYLTAIEYTNPNTLEGNWSRYIRNVITQKGLFYSNSKIVNIPVNLVNTTTNNPHMNAYSTQELLDLFNAGYKIDTRPFYQIKNKAAHIESHFNFIAR